MPETNAVVIFSMSLVLAPMAMSICVLCEGGAGRATDAVGPMARVNGDGIICCGGIPYGGMP